MAECFSKNLLVFLAICIHAALPASGQELNKALQPLSNSFDAYNKELERLDGIIPLQNSPLSVHSKEDIDALLKTLPPPAAKSLPDETDQVKIKRRLSVDLQQALAIAVQNNMALQQQIAGITEKRGLLKSVRGTFYPSLSMRLGAVYSEESVNKWSTKDNQYIFSRPSPFYVPDGGWATLQNNFGVGFAQLNLVYDLISFQRNSALAASKQKLIVAEQNYANRLRQLQLDVSESYYRMQLANQILQIRQVVVDNNQVVLDQVLAMKTAGFVPRVDLLRAKANLEQSKFLLAKAKSESDSSARELSNLINVPFDVTLIASELVRLQPPWPLDLPQTLIRGFDDNPQLRALEARRQAFMKQADEQAAALLPRVGLFATAGLDASQSRIPRVSSSSCCGMTVLPGFNKTSADWSAGVLMRWNLFDAGITAGAVQASQAAADRTLLRKAEVRNQIRQILEQAFYQHKAAMRQIIAAKASYQASREAYRDTRARFEFGLADFTDLADTIRSLTTSMEQKAEAITLVNVSYAHLLRELLPVQIDPAQPVDLSIVFSSTRQN